ncbi:XdhC family protein [Psychrobacter sp. DAB_AL43B]|uniref:XdhC family protein n=1 Tax=Psychrobacter sp. DAB_AL43B TaxID=1028416 RepID=UPI0009A56A79|nr:XdhC/CoxI family protein [Psychrobacter sp. DAB_AL43B]SLJ85414.1 xanthine dehydrogenase accessory protein [Psychrobacter sp. DAB_AL43B]
MNQVADILKLASTAQEKNVDAVLATVVRTEGSAYRRTGAMMLICADGRSVGMISGGCLEPHIIKRAFWLTRNGANVQVYQTGDEQADEDHEIEEHELSGNSYLDNELNFGLGCNGKVHVLFERLKAALPLLDIIRHVRRTQQPATIATLIRSGSNDIEQLPIGMRVDIETYIDSGKITVIDGDSISNQALSEGEGSSTVTHVLRDTVEALSTYEVSDKNTEYVILKNGGLTTEWLLQRLQPQLRLLICGAGNDVMPLVTMAKLQDWHVTIIDSRAQYASRLHFPQADIVMPLSLDDHEQLLKLSDNAAVALMSHSLTQDRARLSVLLEHSTHYKYLGQLGPRYRTERLINEINAVKKNPTALKDGISKLHYPIGYKLGGDGPEALALGIMAQVNAVMYGQKAPAEFSANELSDTAAMSSIATLSCV